MTYISECGYCHETQFTGWYSKSAPRDMYGRIDRDYSDRRPVAYCSEEHRDAADALRESAAAAAVALGELLVEAPEWLPPVNQWEAYEDGDTWSLSASFRGADDLGESVRHARLQKIAAASGRPIEETGGIVRARFAWHGVEAAVWYLRPSKQWVTPDRCATCPTALAGTGTPFVRLGEGDTEAPVICLPCRDRMQAAWIASHDSAVSNLPLKVVAELNDLRARLAGMANPPRDVFLAMYDGAEPELFTTVEAAREFCDDVAKIDAHGRYWDWTVNEFGVHLQFWAHPDDDRPISETSGSVTALVVQGDEVRPVNETLVKAREAAAGMLAADTGEHRPMWRVIITDSESPTGVAPVCTAEDSGEHHVIADFPGGPIPDPEGVYDCCPDPQFDTYSTILAPYLVELLNADTEGGEVA
ncbi:hypothetical protein [Streptomyces sp. NBC_01373]|uniref:hypothetical protein n=1 Tax=Streptomyces sp. NBC_01373 TaxID=2903843 RepID=UPI0022556A46|nr:hypothetical protein [Streptomyces sp. NBC_01373]MCX4705691.1 hypothetical protein [Streptomyces sp. NBC_01373]